MAIFMPLERLFPLHPQRNMRSRLGSGIIYYFLNNLLPKLLLTMPLLLLTGLAHRLVPLGFYQHTESWPWYVRLSLALVIGEIGAYWGHRWSHQVPFLWQFHVLHHEPEEVNWLVHTRAHPVDMVFTRFCGLAPVYLLGLAQPQGHNVDLVPALLSIIGSIWGFFIHADIGWRLGPLEWVIASPAFHHWHHTNDGQEFVNKNFSPLLPWVDSLFGTLYLPNSWPTKYGVDSPTSPVDHY
ncbi:MAG: sterol desaturase family protein [Acidobacteria bacterium]|nr:sterol desaturase family protein [Acidobacteriota bacterium]